jgi:hypothetical protein
MNMMHFTVPNINPQEKFDLHLSHASVEGFGISGSFLPAEGPDG